jgi:ribonucleoside-diphosphate reductase beta chain
MNPSKKAIEMKNTAKNVFGARNAFKPFHYPWAYDLWLSHEQMHWVSREVPLHEDVRDWSNKLAEDDRVFLSNVFLLFTQGDIDVAGGYIKDYLPHFEHPEIRMMLLGFASREATHIDAYSHLTETLGKPDSFYGDFLKIPIMAEKHNFFNKVVDGSTTREQLPIQIAGISAFTEGMFLFSSFVMLLNYPRNGMMKGMGQIVTWSILDEQKHVEGLIRLFRTIIEENRQWWNDALKAEIYSTAEMMMELELDFIDYIFRDDEERHGLKKSDLKQYIRYIVDRRLIAMGMKGINKTKENPLPWIDGMIASQNHENFFESRATSYAKGALTGSWGNVWGSYK